MKALGIGMRRMKNWFSNYSYQNEYASAHAENCARHMACARYQPIHGYDECDWAMREALRKLVETDELVHDRVPWCHYLQGLSGVLLSEIDS